MSQVAISGNASGTGTLTIAAPNTNSNYTLTLPAATGTVASIASVNNNGVVYANSSGQPTTGTAFVFDGTNVGIGTSSPSYQLNTSKAAGSGDAGQLVRFTNTSTGNSLGPFHLTIGTANYFAGNPGIVLAGTNGIALAVGDGSDLAAQRKATIDSSGNLLVGTTDTVVNSGAGIVLFPTQGIAIGKTNSDTIGACIYMNRATVGDGGLIEFAESGTIEGTITISGTTVSYNGGHLSRWAQMLTKPDLLKGTVMSNLDEMNEYVDADGNPVPNEQLNKVKVSDIEGDANVAGVFVNWTHDEAHNVDEINMAMTGDMIIRIAQGTTVQRGDLLMSAGDGTAKPQGDDIVRSKTVAKVTSTHVTCTYADGSFCVPCVLMAC